MRMKLFCILIIMVLAVPVYAEDIEVTIHVDDAYKPFSFEENGQAKGMYIDVLKTAFSRMKGFKVTMKPIPWKRGKIMMEKGDGFGLAPAFFHGHDWAYLHPYSLPFYTETIVAVCAEDVFGKSRSVWPDDYIGLGVGNVVGFDGWGGEKFHSLVKEGKIRYEEVKGSSLNILKLGGGRTECIMTEDKAFDYEFRKLKESGEFTANMKKVKKGAVIGTDSVYIGYSRTARELGKYPFQFDFMQAFDAEIYKMIKSGEIPKIMDAYKD